MITCTWALLALGNSVLDFNHFAQGASWRLRRGSCSAVDRSGVKAKQQIVK
jgi:hypothetical protein